MIAKSYVHLYTYTI